MSGLSLTCKSCRAAPTRTSLHAPRRVQSVGYDAFAGTQQLHKRQNKPGVCHLLDSVKSSTRTAHGPWVCGASYARVGERN